MKQSPEIRRRPQSSKDSFGSSPESHCRGKTKDERMGKKTNIKTVIVTTRLRIIKKEAESSGTGIVMRRRTTNQVKISLKRSDSRRTEGEIDGTLGKVGNEEKISMKERGRKRVRSHLNPTAIVQIAGQSLVLEESLMIQVSHVKTEYATADHHQMIPVVISEKRRRR